MLCSRCKSEFEARQLKPPFILWRVLLTPVFLLTAGRARLLQETFGRYCWPCRRRMNVCLLFIAFLGVVGFLPTILRALGLGNP